MHPRSKGRPRPYRRGEGRRAEREAEERDRKRNRESEREEERGVVGGHLFVPQQLSPKITTQKLY